MSGHHAARAAARTAAFRKLILLSAASWLLVACAVQTPLTGAFDDIELVNVPFFPQTAFQCGPAALATVLAHEGADVTPDDLTPAVFIEELRGSLQAELLGATRRHAFIPYVLEPAPAALLAEVGAGRPVLVLQNLGLPRLPVWHYAVVVGYDAERDRLILRSGRERRRLERSSRFLRSWERAERWAFVALPPGELPATADADRYIRALAGAEPLLAADDLDAAYGAALDAWPERPLVIFAAATHHHARGRYGDAATGYRRLIEREPQHAAARNNLAHALSEQGCHGIALTEAREALAAAGPDHPLYGSIEETVATMEARGAENALSCR